MTTTGRKESSDLYFQHVGKNLLIFLTRRKESSDWRRKMKKKTAAQIFEELDLPDDATCAQVPPLTPQEMFPRLMEMNSRLLTVIHGCNEKITRCNKKIDMLIKLLQERRK